MVGNVKGALPATSTGVTVTSTWMSRHTQLQATERAAGRKRNPHQTRKIVRINMDGPIHATDKIKMIPIQCEPNYTVHSASLPSPFVHLVICDALVGVVIVLHAWEVHRHMHPRATELSKFRVFGEVPRTVSSCLPAWKIDFPLPVHEQTCAERRPPLSGFDGSTYQSYEYFL